MAYRGLDEVDDPGAALRILVELSDSPQEALSVSGLHKVMSEGYCVGRTAVDSSRRALLRAGLTEEYDSRLKGATHRVIRVTSLGFKVVPKIREIAEILRGASN